MKEPLRNLLVAAVAAAIPFAATPLAAAGEADPLAAYSKMHAAMAADRAAGVVAAAAEVASAARARSKSGTHAAAWAAVAEAAAAVRGEELATLREQYKPLSIAMAKLVESGALAGADIYYCSMAPGYWLQAKADSTVRNPYYGSEMLGCGWKVEKVEG
jgi:hypothetical protein